MSSPLWVGKDMRAAELGYRAAREHGLRGFGPLILGNLASFPDAYVKQRTLGSHVGCSIRTVQRYVRRLKELGMLFTRRSRPGELPPNASGPPEKYWCGFAHKWVVGRTLEGDARRAAIEAGRRLRLERLLARDEFTHALARKLGLPRQIMRLGAAATIAATLASSPPPPRPTFTAAVSNVAIAPRTKPDGMSTLEWLEAELSTKPRDGPE